MIKKIRSIFNPDRFQGWGKDNSYFEGWYYKIVSADESKSFAIIAGIAFDENSKSQSFIQVLNGKGLSADYYKFNSSDFKSSDSKFHTNIRGNSFESDKIVMNLKGINGELTFENTVPWPSKWYSPGIMGPFSFVPFMECYHGVLSMKHKINGVLRINGEEVDFTGGTGYIEKDWGRSFPSAYFWMQSNHFKNKEVSIKASLANIPWMGLKAVGLIAGIYIDGKVLEFTSYNLSKLRKSYADKDKVILHIENKRYFLKINVKRGQATELAFPINGFMDGVVNESMTSELHVVLLDKKTNKILLDDIGYNSGLDVAGDIEELFV